jgi:hypothetical protein
VETEQIWERSVALPVNRKNIENCQEIVIGRTVSEIRPQPPFKKGGQGGFLEKPSSQAKSCTGCGPANPSTTFEK